MEAARAAVADDAATIVGLTNASAEELRPTRGGDLWFRRERRDPFDIAECRELIQCRDGHVVVGTIDDVVVGFGVVAVEVLRDESVLGVIRELFVDPGARAVGVGEAMMDSLVAFATGRGCIGVDARVLPGHRAAKNFFEESGFTARAIVMHRRLDA